MQWTVDQQAVLQSRGCNLLVSAAAGSGKTAVLVERILRLVLEGDNPPGLDQILVVTFTQAAAKEMKERVRKELFVLADNGVARAHEQLQLVNYAPISTIHAFCLTILRENFHLVGLEPGFRTGDQAECEYMMTEAVDQLMDDCYQEDTVDEDIADLLDCFSGFRNDQGLREMILSIFRFSRTMPWPDSWMKSAIQNMDIPKGTDFGDTIWGKALLQEAHWHIQSMMQLTEKAYLLAESAGFDGYAETFHLDLVLLEELLDKMNKGWDCAIEAAGALSFTRMKSVSKDADTHTKDDLQSMRKKVKDLAENLVNKHLSGSSDSIIQEIRNEKRRLGKLVELVQQLDRIYSRMKRRKNLIDFDDMEHLTLNLLMTKTENLHELTEVAKNMQKSWKHIMVDEYQDSSLVQEAILKAIAVETDHFGNLFMVGDVKQSIYRFRQAMPELFLEKYSAFPVTEGHKNRKIVLHQNFRSRKPIIHAVNYVFDRLMSRDLGEMNYTVEDALQPGADYLPWEGTDGAPVSFHLIDSLNHSEVKDPDDHIASDNDPEKHQMNSTQGISVSSNENYGSDDSHTQAARIRNDSLPVSHLSDESVVNQEELVAIQQEAVWAAHMIDSMVNGSENKKPFTIVEQGVIRPLRYSDCLLLLRTTAGWSSVFTEEFSSMGVPLYTDTGASYFESIEVGIILSLLQIIDNPLQDIPLAAVLRSPVFGWTETQIASVRSADSKQTLYKAIIDSDFIPVSEYDRVMTQKKRQDFLDRLRSWRSYAKMVSVRVLLDRIYDESGFLLYTAALPQGERRSSNLKLLAERAARFETTGYKGLFQFLRYVERIRSNKGDMDGAKILGEGENVVRLMSIHKSKGLEYPVVLLCGTGKKFNLQDQNKKLLYHHKYGFGPDHILPELGVTWATSAKKAIQSVTLKETISEEMRILYVAMTRAKERLLICGRISGPDKTIENMDNYQFDKLPPFIVFSLRNHAQWLAAAWAPLLRKGNTIDFRVFQQNEMIHMKKNAIERENQRLTGEFELSVQEITETNKGRKKTLFSGIPGQVNMFQNGSHGDVDTILEKNRIEAERRLKWKSRYLELSKIPSKMTVTELKRRWVEEDQSSAQIDRAFQLSDSSTPRHGFLPGTTDMLSCSDYPENMDIHEKSVETVIAGKLHEIKETEIQPSMKKDNQDITLQDMVMPKFYSGEHKAKDSFRYGTIMHKILQNIEPDKNNVYDIEVVIEHLVSDGYLLEEERSIPDRKVLKRYIDSDIFHRMCHSNGIRREMPFTVRMPIHDIIQNIDVVTDETIIVQGVIDCWFVEDKQIVLVDYKTDRNTMRLSAYRRQLHWYAEALHKITGFYVKEKVIWFLHLGLEIRI